MQGTNACVTTHLLLSFSHHPTTRTLSPPEPPMMTFTFPAPERWVGDPLYYRPYRGIGRDIAIVDDLTTNERP